MDGGRWHGRREETYHDPSCATWIGREGIATGQGTVEYSQCQLRCQQAREGTMYLRGGDVVTFRGRMVEWGVEENADGKTQTVKNAETVTKARNGKHLPRTDQSTNETRHDLELSRPLCLAFPHCKI